MEGLAILLALSANNNVIVDKSRSNDALSTKKYE